MSDNYYSKNDIVKSLQDVGLKKGDQVLIHSNIGLFGVLKDADKRDDYYAFLKQAVFEVIGNEGTMVNPTFSYSFCKGEDFDVMSAPSDCGLLSELALKDIDAIRSEDANFSIVAVGANAHYFTEDSSEYSFGKYSFWDRFLQKDGILLFFNMPHTFSTFNHFVENQLKVPYRYDKAFKGKVISAGLVSERTYYHYVRDLNADNGVFVDKFTQKAKECGLVKTVKLGRGEISAISSRDCFDLIDKELKNNPAFLIKGEVSDPELKTKINNYFDRLFPINRSLTGNGNRETLEILSELVDLEISEVPSGTECYDWTVPPEWNIKEAWIKDSRENVIVNFAENNLFLLGYSEPFQGKLSYSELKEHIYTSPDQPDIIPYVTSYYRRRWGFCMPHSLFEQLNQEEEYEVFIDSSLNENGSMTIGEALIKGKSDREILFSTYICHPSLANNELSGPLVAAFIYQKLKEMKNLKYTYRFVFVPETIGSIYYLSKNGENLKHKLEAGFVLTCIGDAGKFTYKRSRLGNALPDRVTELLLKQTEKDFNIIDFFPSGSDERQYCSPAFNLPVGSLMRTMYGKYPEYHTSGDNKSLISFEAMEKSIEKYIDIIEVIEKNEKYINTMPYCEPQLGKRGLWPTLGAQKSSGDFIKAMMWILNLADGDHDLIAMSERSGISLKELIPVLDNLMEKGIIKV